MKFKSDMLQVYLIAGTQDVGGDVADYLRRVEASMKAGITAFQFRDKDGSKLTSSERLDLAKRSRQLATKYNVPFIIDDDYEMAINVHADGVHVGQKDQRIDEVLRAVGDEMFVGYSCDTLDQIEHANQLPIAYVGSGPVFPTGSKDDADPVMGFVKLHELVEQSVHPIVAVGGITPANAADVIKTGVAGISGISMIMKSTDVVKTVDELKRLY